MDNVNLYQDFTVRYTPLQRETPIYIKGTKGTVTVRNDKYCSYVYNKRILLGTTNTVHTFITNKSC